MPFDTLRDFAAVTLATTTPEQFGAYLRGDLARWAKLARTTNIRVD